MGRKKFSFRLERIARVRDAAEREARAEMGRERRAADLARERAEAAALAARAALDQLADAPDPRARIAGEPVVAALAARAAAQREDAARAAQAAVEATERWREARVEAEAIVKLRGKAFERFVAEAEKADEVERDEQTMQRFGADPGTGRAAPRALKTVGKKFR